MSISGINEEVHQLIATVFSRHPEITKVVLFGSRAKGTARPNSDIDLAVEGIKNQLQIEALALELDDLPLPYKFDVTSLAGISNTALREHINRVGLVIYKNSDKATGNHS